VTDDAPGAGEITAASSSDRIATLYEAALQHYESGWKNVDAVLREVVKGAGWTDFGAVYTKVVFVNGVYATRLDRSLGSGALRDCASRLLEAGERLSPILADLASQGSILTSNAAQTAISAHGRILAALQPEGSTDKTVRSFASKFLHFHAGVAPIFDGTASGATATFRRLGPQIRSRRALRLERDACRPEHEDWDARYFQHVVQVRLLWDHLAAHVRPERLTVKGIDHMLMLGHEFLESRLKQ
jgi:hypothetical protein